MASSAGRMGLRGGAEGVGDGSTDQSKLGTVEAHPCLREPFRFHVAVVQEEVAPNVEVHENEELLRTLEGAMHFDQKRMVQSKMCFVGRGGEARRIVG